MTKNEDEVKSETSRSRFETEDARLTRARHGFPIQLNPRGPSGFSLRFISSDIVDMCWVHDLGNDEGFQALQPLCYSQTTIQLRQSSS